MDAERAIPPTHRDSDYNISVTFTFPFFGKYEQAREAAISTLDHLRTGVSSQASIVSMVLESRDIAQTLPFPVSEIGTGP
jgi:hypothetical protein